MIICVETNIEGGKGRERFAVSLLGTCRSRHKAKGAKVT